MRFGKLAATIAALSLSSSSLVAPAVAQIGQSIGQKTAEKQAEIPTCTHKLGALAVNQPQNNWWTALGVESPESLLKVFVQKSGCFTLVDRGAGFAMAQQERALASGGQLQQGSNIGGGQVRAADYILVPDIVNKNANASGTNIGGILGGFIGGGVGALVSSINIKSSTADVVLTVTNVRTSEQQAMDEGHGSKTDLGIGFGGGWGGWGGFGGAGISNYQNTAIGQVLVLAYIDAYAKLVNDLGGLSPDAKSDAPAQTVTVARPGVMRVAANEKSKVLKPIDAGTILYPTGQKDGVWWEVSDEVGNKGWISSLSLSNAK
jgi:curli biogenesis system outer membrane secretion channel CsgG